jgi:hypothetical protein
MTPNEHIPNEFMWVVQSSKRLYFFHEGFIVSNAVGYLKKSKISVGRHLTTANK